MLSIFRFVQCLCPRFAFHIFSPQDKPQPETIPDEDTQETEEQKETEDKEEKDSDKDKSKEEESDEKSGEKDEDKSGEDKDESAEDKSGEEEDKSDEDQDKDKNKKVQINKGLKRLCPYKLFVEFKNEFDRCHFQATFSVVSSCFLNVHKRYVSSMLLVILCDILRYMYS